MAAIYTQLGEGADFQAKNITYVMGNVNIPSHSGGSHRKAVCHTATEDKSMTRAGDGNTRQTQG